MRLRPCSRSSLPLRPSTPSGASTGAFLTVIAATVGRTLATGLTFALLGVFKLGNLVRYVPYPVVGGFLGGTGWLLFKAASASRRASRCTGVRATPAAARRPVALDPGVALRRRVARRGEVREAAARCPCGHRLGLVLFAVVVLVTGSSSMRWRRASGSSGRFRPVSCGSRGQCSTPCRAPTGRPSPGRSRASPRRFSSPYRRLFNVSGIELIRHTDLDTNRELRDAGIVTSRRAPSAASPDTTRSA